jgi:multidrug transporter EmrE-like cation transporter
MITYIYFIVGAFFNSFAAYLIKISFSNINSLSDLISKGFIKESILILLALISFFLAFIFYGLVLSKTNLSVAQPVFTALSMFFVIIISLFLLNEPFSIKYFIGLFLIIIGILIVSQS